MRDIRNRGEYTGDGMRDDTFTTPRITKETIVKERDQWNDQLEAVQFLTKVFSTFSKGEEGKITSDLVLAKFDERQRTFIIESIKQAFAMRRQLPLIETTTVNAQGDVTITQSTNEVSDRIFETMCVESIMMGILHRNIDKNVLMDIVGGVRRQEEEATPVLNESVMTKLMSKLPGGKKPVEAAV